jgi:branched-chain amino acid transport system substrate-binding protein
MRRLNVVPLFAILLLAFSLSNVGAQAKSTAAGTINIGVITSLSGAGGVIGVGQRYGAELAIEKINSEGGILVGKKNFNLAAVIRDDESAPDVAIRRMREMARDYKVTAFVGGTLGNISMALSNESKNAELFYIASNGVPEDFFRNGMRSPTAASIVAAAEWAGRGAAAYMIDKLKVKRIACFMPDYAIGKSTLAGFEQIIKARPGVEYKIFWHPVGAPDLTAQLIQAREYAPEILFMGSWGGDAITALKQANEMGLKKQMKIMHFWLMNAFATGIPAAAIEGVYGQMFWYHDMSGFKDKSVVDATASFSSSYVRKYGDPPDGYAMTTYYAVIEAARAMTEAGDTDPKHMMSALMAKPKWQGAKGKATWRKDGAVVYDYATWIVVGKGEGERTATTYDRKFDYAKIVDVYDGGEYVPPISTLGY